MALHSVFGKLQFKLGQGDVCVLAAPYEFEPALSSIGGPVDRALRSGKRYRLILAFVQTEVEIRNLASVVRTALIEDGLLWFAYPKKTSKKFNVAIHRDAGWEPLGKVGFEGVRMIAIDEDWSAVRFRESALIKSFERNPKFAISIEGKERAAEKRELAAQKKAKTSAKKKSTPKKKVSAKKKASPKKKTKKK
ncbi:hypothetical protein CH373_13460 [Leptospira perolatii]|uniref:DUF3052 domain-containing protein n=1 Tax=Leptospira perolatii TaxID=2023191 RepID=A0A2M9ZKZ1_9LEPT|nr:hypothetical protein [Leptospira perolatii]PJZ69887.1 hypothetical protein CH360_08225 [Leptospira perolatii]PJZ72705.1 hypothetical protein CH373_13460 [Leptospira perolatii]